MLFVATSAVSRKVLAGYQLSGSSSGPIWAGRATRAEPLLLREAVCVGVHPVVLNFSARTSALFAIDISRPPFDCPLNVDSFAQADGFADALEMGRYFVKWHGPGRFRGVLIRW